MLKALLTSQLITQIGSELTRFAFPLWLYEQRGSAFAVTLAYAVPWIPRLVLGPFVGALVDHKPKKQMLLACEIGQALTILLLIAAITRLNPGSPIALTSILSLLTIQALFSLLQYPTVTAILSSAPEPTRRKGNGWLSAIESSCLTLGPILGGLFLQFGNLSTLLMLDFATFVISIVILVFWRPALSEFASKVPYREIVDSVLASLRDLLGQKLLLRFLTLNTTVNFAFALSIGLSTPYLRTLTEVGKLGLYVGAAGFVEVLGGLAAVHLPPIEKRARFQLWCALALGLLGYLPMALAKSAAGVAIGYASLLFILAILNATNRLAWMEIVPHAQIGRFTAIRRSISSTIAPLGFLLSGLLFDAAPVAWPESYRFRSLFALSALVLVTLFVVNIKAKWRERFDA